ncbi:hypothetical protein IWX50DRAFT_277409 [Phyllosticta citricarpa]|uniref:Uncharacterized protein n=1 Tax=Phyllosticta citricarpa TaxID=55181 RepID=A0ABR1MKB3_9PEZI
MTAAAAAGLDHTFKRQTKTNERGKGKSAFFDRMIDRQTTDIETVGFFFFFFFFFFFSFLPFFFDCFWLEPSHLVITSPHHSTPLHDPLEPPNPDYLEHFPPSLPSSCSPFFTHLQLLDRTGRGDLTTCGLSYTCKKTKLDMGMNGKRETYKADHTHAYTHACIHSYSSLNRAREKRKKKKDGAWMADG